MAQTPVVTPLLGNPQVLYTDREKGPTSQSRQSPWWLPQPLDDPRVWRPLSIASGPFPILCFIWIFFAFTSKAPVPLPDYFVPIVRAHTQSTTMVVAIIATIISAYVSFFFSLAVRYIITILLATSSTSLDVLSSATRIAQKTVWLHDLRVKWTWIVLVAYLGINLQTSALTSFFTIREIKVTQGLSGHDVDMASPRILQEGARVLIPRAYGQLTSAFFQSIMISSLQFERNISTTFNFNGYTYLSPTGGIQPASFVPTHVVHLTNKTNLIAPPNLQDITGNKHTMLPFNKTMQLVQQGLTADVDCRVGDSQALTTYQASLENLGTSVNLTLVDLAVTCPATNRTSRIGPVVYETGDPNVGSVLANICQIPNTSSWDVIFRTTPPYSILDRTICTVTPQITTVNVTYSNPQDPQSLTTLKVSQPIHISNDVPVWAFQALEVLLFNVVLGQSTLGSAIGNAWLLTAGSQAQVNLAGAMNTYIRAGIEFFGTVVRQLYTQPDSIFFPGGWDSISDPMRTQINGTFVATTYGWYQEHRVAPLFLLPTTLTIVATYILLAYGVALAIKHKDQFLKEDADFDPTNIVHIIAAHAPETRTSDFRTFSDQPAGYIKKIWVRLRHREGIRAFDVSTTEDGNPTAGGHPGGRDSGVRDSTSQIK